MISRCLLSSRTSAASVLRQRGMASAAADPPKFDAEMVAIYSRLAEQHRHPKGPWPLMTDTVAAIAGGKDAAVKVLDLASGPGEPAKVRSRCYGTSTPSAYTLGANTHSQSIAKWMPNSIVIASDVSEDMISKHEQYLEGVPNVTSLLASAEDLSAVPSDSQDIVTCCYGYMFPADKDKALEESYRVLKPGGSLVATTWDRVDMVAITGDIMEAVLGERPPPPPLNPMSLSEPGLFEGMVTKAGFKDIEISKR